LIITKYIQFREAASWYLNNLNYHLDHQ